MPKSTGYSPIGIDLQPNGAKMVQLYFGKQGTAIAAHATVAFEGNLLQVEDNPLPDAVQAIKKVLRQHGFRGKKAVVSLPPTKVDVRIQTLAGTGDDLEKMLRWEAESYLHYDIATACMDFVKLGEMTAGNEKRSEVLVAAASKSYVLELLALLEKAGLVAEAIDIVPMALCRILSAGVPNAGEAPVSITDIGRTASTAVVINKGNLRFTRSIRRGGEDFTARICESLEVNHEEAELLKREYGTGGAGGTVEALGEEGVTNTEIAGTLREILRHDLEEMAGELQKLLRYFSSQCKGMSIRGGYLCGGGARMKGLSEFLTEHTGTQMTQLPSLDTIFTVKNGKTKSAGPEYAVAAGLALRS